ncbi:MAG: hypothetical protein N2Z74_05800 [Syntrophales bacterium]|nr:hypothetical protein [Syntrophales bacterium]
MPPGNFPVVYPITAGALIAVGFFMISVVRDIDGERFAATLPAFLIIVGIPLTYNISYGFGFGFTSYSAIKLIMGQQRKVSPLFFAISTAFPIAFPLPFR